MNWYIGQEVVCVKTHSQGFVKKDQIVTILGLHKKSCCGEICIDIGISNSVGRCRCVNCNEVYPAYSIWLSEKLFAPLMDISELESILKEETINK